MTASIPRRKGASRSADITPELLRALSLGEIETATLTESLAVDQALLLQAVFPEDWARLEDTAQALGQLGVLKRMECVGALLWQTLGQAGWERCLTHRSDTARGWACFMADAQPDLTLRQRLDLVRPLADDAHFGVREWAWMGVRPHLAGDLPQAVDALSRWTDHSSERLRRFASEALRPRGVWCSHIAALKQQPEIALPLLEPLRSDASGYVQDSVANWLNDAAKSRPDWVRALCARWLRESPLPATRRICARAQRSLKNPA
ncbi:DNA alkylation repair protein [Comamonas sp. C11]|uniref:DNA alkylation repair protein n=1 Tax=Comamonas sp. C11 TaxID=2966554 RepID=UPI002111E985|nr:DNA alkylation repair protein [Comamonas sp. C11]UUC91752.1 DNA alkylation repair protein [Comamonas sp. C11]